MILILADTHWKRDPESPYNKGLRKLFDYLVKKFKNAHLIQTGDLLDDDLMHSSVVKTAAEYLQQFKSRTVATGNHELGRYGNRLKEWSLMGINIIETPEVIQLDGLDIKIFPYLPRLEDMKAYAQDRGEYDLTVSHIARPGQNFGSPDEIDLQCKARIAHLYGHIHLPDESVTASGRHITLGVPQVTRNGEQHHKPRIAIVEDGKLRFEELPVFFTIEDVVYGEKPQSKDNIINILDAPSVDMVREEYKEFHIREEGIKLKRTENEITLSEQVEKSLSHSLKEKFLIWAKANDLAEETVRAVIDRLPN